MTFLGRRNLLRAALVAALLLGGAPQALASAPTRTAAAQQATRKKPVKTRPRIKRLYKRGLSPLSRGTIVRIGSNRLVAESEYRDLRNSVKDLLGHFPPDKSYFVGLGRDPAPIIGFLQELGGESQAMNFPGASGKGWGVSLNPQWSEFEKYFSKFFPKDVLEGTRDIVLIDQTNSGASRKGTLHQFAPFVERYLKQIGFKGKLKMAAFSGQAQPSGTVQIDVNKYPAVSRFLWHPYEGVVSEYPRHVIGYGNISDAKKRPAYLKFRGALRERMQRDVDLDAFLIKTYGLPGRPAGARKIRPWPAAIKMPAAKGAAPGAGPLMTANVPARRASGNYWARRAGQPAESFSYLDATGYKHTRDGVLRMMRKFRPDTHFYVGVGRSATAYQAMLDSVGRDLGAYLPVVGDESWSGREPASSTRQKYYAMFDAVLPARARSGARKIVLYQRSDTQLTLQFTQKMLREYFNERGADVEVEVLQLRDGRNTSSMDGVTSFDVGRSKELRSLNTRKYEAVAPYGGGERPVDGRLSIERGAIDAKGRLAPRGATYGQFQRHMSERVAHDATLGAELASLVGGAGGAGGK